MSDAVPVPGRVAWVDYAKGICIVAVVSMYATFWANDTYADLTHHTPSLSWMNHWVDFARPFRMPDFFLLSGLFIGRVIDRPWMDYYDKRVLHYLYFFLLWTLILFLCRYDLPTDGGLGVRLKILALMLVEPYAMLWFIQMLAAFSLAVRWTRRWPSWLVFVGALGLQLLELDSTVYGSQVVRFCEYFAYFYGGYLFSGSVFKLTGWAQAHVAAAVGALLTWGVANALLVHLGWADMPGVSAAMGFAGALAIAVLGALLSRYRWAEGLRYLGEHSIVVYLAFLLPLIGLTMTWSRLRITWDQGWSTVLMIVVSILVSLMLYWWTRGTTLDFLFHRPQWARLRARRTEVGEPA